MKARSEPGWLCEAVACCPAEAEAMHRRSAELQALPVDAPMEHFIAAYERMLAARDHLDATWIARK